MGDKREGWTEEPAPKASRKGWTEEPVAPPEDPRVSFLKSAGNTALRMGAKGIERAAHPIDTLKDLSDFSPNGLGGAYVHGAGRGYGVVDELEGVLGALAYEGAPGRKTPPTPQGSIDAYRKARDQRRHDDAVAQQKNPDDFGASQLATSVNSALALPGGGATKLARVGNAAAQGAALGLANSDADLTKGEFKDAAIDTAKGAALNAAGQGVIEGGGALAKRFSNYLHNTAGNLAVTAAGTRAGISDKLANLGVAPEQIPDLGNKMLDKGLIPSGLNPIRSPLESVQRSARALNQSSGEEIGDVYSGFDAARPFGPLPHGQSHLDFGRTAEASQSPLRGATASELEAGSQARNVGDKIRQQGSISPGSAAGMHDELANASRGVNWSTEKGGALSEGLHKFAVRSARNDLKDQVGEQLGGAERARLEGANRDYRTGTIADELSTNALSRDAQTKPFKTLRQIMAAAGAGGAAASGNGLALSAATPWAIEQLMSRGPSAGAWGARGASKLLGAGASLAEEEGVAAALRRLGAQAAEDEPPDQLALLKRRFGGK